MTSKSLMSFFVKKNLKKKYNSEKTEQKRTSNKKRLYDYNFIKTKGSSFLLSLPFPVVIKGKDSSV